MDERPLVFAFWMIFSVKKKMGFWVFLVHPTVVLVLLYALVEICFVTRMRDFFLNIKEKPYNLDFVIFYLLSSFICL